MSEWERRIQEAQRKSSYTIAGSTYPRVRYGNEDAEMASVAAHHPCRDCEVRAGQLHVPGCAVERCPACGGQAISCACG